MPPATPVTAVGLARLDYDKMTAVKAINASYFPDIPNMTPSKPNSAMFTQPSYLSKNFFYLAWTARKPFTPVGSQTECFDFSNKRNVPVKTEKRDGCNIHFLPYHLQQKWSSFEYMMNRSYDALEPLVFPKANDKPLRIRPFDYGYKQVHSAKSISQSSSWQTIESFAGMMAYLAFLALFRG